MRSTLMVILRWINSRGLRGKLRQQQNPVLVNSADESAINLHLISFVRRHISTVDLFRGRTRPSRRALSRYTDFIVGSDQVWRAKYSDVPTALFNFVPEKQEAKMLSYAASFGVGDSSEFTDDLRRHTRPLAARFAGISVRESSGVDLVLEMWNRHDAIHHVDPTLLHEAEAYGELIRCAPTLSGSPSPGGVVSYVLDPSPEKQALGERVANHFRVSHATLLRPDPPTRRDYKKDPSSFQKIPVEAWLAGIRDAKALVSDSFHGCVFAILFHVPFVAIPNQKRGAERFKSLLGQFGLEHRMVTETRGDIQERVDQVLSNPIDWVRVDALVRSERLRAMQYLDAHLQREDETHA